MTDRPQWNFPKHLRGRMHQDPIESEFFTTESVGGLPHALVRETIQNSLDAKANDFVHIRFALLEQEEMVIKDKYLGYVEDLIPHIHAENNGLHNPPEFVEPMKFLVIEDFGTRGLEGDPLVDRPNKTDSLPQDFFYFWRNVGRSGKSEDDRGRWGLGKTVFPASSQINTFWGMTQRKSDGRELLMGLSVLKEHHVNDQAYTSYGHFGIIEDDEVDFSKPADNDNLINEFVTTFQLARQDSPRDPGLSIVIPLPDDSITRESIAKAVIKQYYYPILTGELVITVDDTGPEHGLIMNKDRLGVVLDDLDNDDDFRKDTTQRLIDLAQWAIALPDDEHIFLKEPHSLYKAPSWDYDFLDEGCLAERRAAFRNNERVAFKVPVKVQLHDEEPVISWFKVYIERDEELTSAESHYIRGGITITGIKSLRQRGIRGMVVIEDGPLATLLGDAENPAHTEWQENRRGFKANYLHGPWCLRFVKNSLSKLTRALTDTGTDVDKDLLSDIFYVEDEESPQISTERRSTRKKGKRSSGSHPEISRRPPVLVVTPIDGGFQIQPNPKSEMILSTIHIELAYDVRKGNPFAKYRPYDFDLADSSIHITTKGLTIDTQQDNILDAVVEDHDFYISLEGFDALRDLKIDTKWKEKIQ